MRRDVRLVKPEITVREAAALMAQIDAGWLPVAASDRLIGMVTDRVIAIRAVAAGKSLQTKVSKVMSQEMLYCFEDQELDDVAKNMGQNQVRRLPVVNHDKRLVGILSLGDLARREKSGAVGKAVSKVSVPSQKHSQTAHQPSA